jgi:hypothetical protein
MTIRMIALVVVATACGTSLSKAPGSAGPSFPIPATSALIEEIRFERTTCLGSCPAYRYVLFRQGNAGYCGRFAVPMLGGYTAALSEGAFDHLASVVLKSGFLKLEPDDATVWADAPSTIVAVRVQDSVLRVVRDGYSPGAFWTVSQAVDSLAARLSWHSDSSMVCTTA